MNNNIFEEPPRRIKRHRSNNYDPYSNNNWTNNNNNNHNKNINNTNNVQFASPPRKSRKRNIKQFHRTAPRRYHRHRITSRSTLNEDECNNNINDDGFISSPISTKYQQRIIPNTCLYGNDKRNNHNKNEIELISSPFGSPSRNRYRNNLNSKKFECSPISPTFEPINKSPSRTNKINLCDRFTPNIGDINRYNLHSPTKRFVHNNKNNLITTNIILPSPRKKRKLGQNYSGTNDDPSSLNHKLKEKLSQHTYNQLLQSELLGFAAQHSNIVNNDNDDDHDKNDNISNIQHDVNDNNQQEQDEEDDSNMNDIYGSPSLPNRRMRRNNNHQQNGNNNNNSTPNRNMNNNDNSHHPLCPCYGLNNGINGNAEDHSLNSEESSQQIQNANNNNNRRREMDENIVCVCDSITSNVTTDFLMSPQRTLRFNGDMSMNQENINNMNDNNNDHLFRMTPIKQSSQSTLSGSRKSMRNIAKSPFKVLDAPRLTDDFYLNLVDWSSSLNILSVGLGECVYLWSAFTSKVTKLTDLTKLFEENPNYFDSDSYRDGYDMVCSVGWSKNHQLNDSVKLGDDNYLAVGSGSGYVLIFDSTKSCLVRSPLKKHNHRVGVISWKNSNLLASGSRDRNIYLRDIRIADNQSDIISELIFHKQEVCGLKWSEDSLYLASGGNDNKLAIWDVRYVSKNKPLCFGRHKAAVKAITWSPHESGLIATGGGTADRCIKFWNINNFISSSSKQSLHRNNNLSQISPPQLSPITVIDTGSQVCNLLWSKNVNEIVSTHGYSLNQIVVWKYPTMDKIVTLTGHTYRVLYLASSPDGQTIVTGAGDETLRLWNIFPKQTNNQSDNENNNFIIKPYGIPLHIR